MSGVEGDGDEGGAGGVRGDEKGKGEKSELDLVMIGRGRRYETELEVMEMGSRCGIEFKMIGRGQR